MNCREAWKELRVRRHACFLDLAQEEYVQRNNWIQWCGEPRTRLVQIGTGSQKNKKKDFKKGVILVQNGTIKKQEDLSDVMEKSYVSSWNKGGKVH